MDDRLIRRIGNAVLEGWCACRCIRIGWVSEPLGWSGIKIADRKAHRTHYLTDTRPEFWDADY